MPKRAAVVEVEAGDRSGKPVACLLAPQRTITVTGARGGHGASTVAAAMALFAARHRPTTLVARDLWAAAVLLGLADPGEGAVEVTPALTLAREPADRADVVVVDGGTGPPSTTGAWYVVLRALLPRPGRAAERYRAPRALPELRRCPAGRSGPRR